MTLSPFSAALCYYLIPLILTILIEGAAACLFRFTKKELARLLLINCVTNPAVNLMLYLTRLALWPDALIIPVLEICAVMAEALLLKRLCGSNRRWLLLSLLFNGLSCGLGFVLYYVIRS